MNKIAVRVPATTANIGPGFDSMGCALALYNYITCEVLPVGELRICGCPAAYQNEDNLAVQGYRAVLKRLGLPDEGLSLTIEAEIPVCRGLGSSAALIAGGAWWGGGPPRRKPAAWFSPPPCRTVGGD